MRPSTAKAPKTKPRSGHDVWRWIRLLYFVIFLFGACISGYVCYDLFRGELNLPDDPIDAAFLPPSPEETLSPLPAIEEASPTPEIARAGIPAARLTAVPGLPALPTPTRVPTAGALTRWDRTGRVNFLLIGVDLRPGETVGFNTDSLIVVTVDPATKAVGMLSIPRDLWVQIPGYGENRINTAFNLGVRRGYPGGGPALLKKTILDNLGIQIHYYALINFVGFRRLVDALGGLTINVPRDLYDPTFPNDSYGYKPLTIKKGVQHMSGQQALDYARTRHVDNDFGRMKRQQQVLVAMKDQALRIDVLPKIPALWASKNNLAQTDLSLEDVIALVQMARDIKTDNVQNAVIGDAETQDWVTPSGAMVLLPDRARIRTLVSTMFKTTTALPTTDLQPGEQFKKLAGEAARIEVSNGAGVDGLGGRVAEWLKSQGFTVVLVDSADRSDYAQTNFLESADKPFTHTLLSNILRMPAERARRASNAPAGIDLRLILGKDFDVNMLPSTQ